MAEQQNEPLDGREYSLIGKALFDLLGKCPHIPEDMDIDYNTERSETSMALITAGGNYRKKNVLGGFTAKLNFQVAYISMPTNNPGRMNAQEFLENVMSWLEDVKSLPRLTNNRTITSITASDVLPFKDDEAKDGKTIYVANAVMEYEAD